MERRNDGGGGQLVTKDPGDRVALRGVRLLGRVSGLGVRATIEQTFVNLEPRAIEAVYTFPMTDGAAVCGFEVVTGDRVLTGIVEETDDAIEKYETAIAEGDGAFMLEQERPDVFTARVGNLLPRQAATIRLTFIAPAEVVDRVIRLSFPTTVAPRYVTASGSDDALLAQVDGDALNPPHVLSVPYGLSMRLEVALARDVLEIASPTHAVRVEEADDHSRIVTFADGVAEMDRDLVLTIALRREQRPVVQVAGGVDGASYLAVTWVPEFDLEELAEPAAGETVFLLDCSGSMQGESIAQATAALELCLRAMNPGDWFNVCRFGSTYEMLASEPLKYSEETLRRAIAWVRRGADLGGTEIFEPLQKILRPTPVVGQLRTVVVLTDGQVSNEPTVVELARKHRAHNRIFSFGIGAASSQFLVNGLARATGGAAEFITGGERIEEKVLRTFGRIASPAVTDVAIDWGGADVQTLAEVPPAFDGDALTVYGRCAGRLPEQVTLRCTAAGAAKSWPVRVGSVFDDGGTVARMWARRAIQSLEEVNGVRRTSVSERREGRARDELVKLSKSFGLLCSLTTFVAVEHRSLEERNEGRPELRRVPVKIAKDWGGVDVGTGVMALAGGGMICRAMPAPAPAGAAAAPKRSRGFMQRFLGSKKARSADAAIPPTPAAPPQADGAGSGLLDLTRESDDTSLDAELFDEITPHAPGDTLGDWLSTQTAAGSFSVERSALDDASLRAGTSREEWEKELEGALPSLARHVDRVTLVTTAIVLLILAKLFGSEKAQWRRAWDKGCRFIGRLLGVSAKEVDVALTALL